MRVDWLIVGAGLTGATVAERIASQLDQRVLVVEKRDHVAGNAFDSYNEHGILIHNYGPHIFHTNDKRVWDYLSQFTDWQPYYHRVLGVIDGKLVPIPFNLNSLYALFPPEYAKRLEGLLLEHYRFGDRVSILHLRENADESLRYLANYIYEKVFSGYTLKQWGTNPESLDCSLMERVPIHISRDDSYFHDTYQAIPKQGYTELVRRMLGHRNIALLMQSNYRDVASEVQFNRMIFTGSIDEFFDYVHGVLPYRSLRLEFRTLSTEWYQETATVNYPGQFDFTRVTEFKHFHYQPLPLTTILYEYPAPFVVGENERCYPVPQEQNYLTYDSYLREAKSLKGTVLFGGRLGDYRYYNMDQAVARGLQLFEHVASS